MTTKVDELDELHEEIKQRLKDFESGEISEDEFIDRLDSIIKAKRILLKKNEPKKV